MKILVSGLLFEFIVLTNNAYAGCDWVQAGAWSDDEFFAKRFAEDGIKKCMEKHDEYKYGYVRDHRYIRCISNEDLTHDQTDSTRPWKYDFDCGNSGNQGARFLCITQWEICK